MTRIAAAVLALVALGANPSAASSPPHRGAELRLAEVRAPKHAVVARFFGHPPESEPGEPVPPVSFGVTRLCFVFGGGACVPFKPRGQLFFSDWRLEIFSPDGAFVLLLQDRFGPYHAVRIERLKAYLGGAAPDDVIVDRPSPPGGFVPVHADAHWTGNRTFEFSAQGETTRKIVHTVP